MFRKLGLKPNQVIGIESCNFEQIRIEVKQEVDVEKFQTSVAIQIRNGLKVKPMKELKRTTRVKVCWVRSDVPNKEVIDTLSLFGKVVGEPQDLYFELTEEEERDSDLYGLKGIKSGERAVEIELLKNIPSYVKIAGKRARIWYPGQTFYCGRCYKTFKQCPGKADRRECLRLKGKEKDFEEFWQDILKQQPRKQRMTSEDEFGVTTVDLSWIHHEVEKDELILWLKDKGDITVTEEHLTFSGFPGTWRLGGINSEEMMRDIVERLNGAKMRGKPILCLPIRVTTPTKGNTGPATNMEPAAQGEEADIDPTKVSDGTETAEEKAARHKREAEENTRKSVEAERLRLEKERAEAAKAEADAKAAQTDGQEQQESERDSRAAAPGSGDDKRDPQAAALSGGEGDGERECGARGKDGDVDRPSTLVGQEALVTSPEVSASTENRVSNNLTSAIRNFGVKFGLLKKSGNIEIGSSSAHQETSAPQPSTIPETPIEENRNHNPGQIGESPELVQRKEEAAQDGNLTIASTDDIFNSPKHPPNLSKEEVKAGGKRKAIVLGSPTPSSSSDDSVESAAEVTADTDLETSLVSPQKTKTKVVVVESTPKGAGLRDKEVDEEGFSAKLTKGQKKAARLRRQAAERAESQHRPPPKSTSSKQSKKQSNAAKKMKNF